MTSVVLRMVTVKVGYLRGDTNAGSVVVGGAAQAPWLGLRARLQGGRRGGVPLLRALVRGARGGAR